MIALHGYGETTWSSSEPASLAREGFMKNPVVYRCIRMIGEAAASLPWLLYENEHELDAHPMLNLLNQPRQGLCGQEFLEKIYGYLLVHGNAYLHLVSIGDEPREIHALSPKYMALISGSDGHPAA